MRIRCALLLALPAAVLATAATGLSASTPLPCADYPWAHPGTAVLAVPYGQPPMGIPVSGCTLIEAVPGSGYVWAHPWTTTVNVPHAQPPAEIPTG